MAKTTQQGIDELRAAVNELMTTVDQALIEISDRVEQAPESVDDPAELEAIKNDVLAAVGRIREGTKQSGFEPSTS